MKASSACTRRVIELGGLVQKAGLVTLTDDDRATMLGAFMELADRLRAADDTCQNPRHLAARSRRRGLLAFDTDRSPTPDEREHRDRISLMAHYQVGECFSRDVTFDADSIRSFATLAGDRNPLHHDPDYASRSRFGGLIASGTQYGALLMGMVGTHLTRGTMALGVKFSLRCRKAVRAGQTLRLEWTITAVEPKPSLGGDFICLEGRIVDVGGIIYLTASATCLVTSDAADPTSL